MSVETGQANAAWMHVASTPKVHTVVSVKMGIMVTERLATMTTSAVRYPAMKTRLAQIHAARSVVDAIPGFVVTE